MIPELSQAQYHDLRTTGGIFHRCQTCGRCEYAGAWCSWCGVADYVLEAHRHPQGRSCPLPPGSPVSVANGGHVVGLYRHLPGASNRRPAR